MKKTAIYPGSFNPWHKGHLDILTKALDVFDQVVIAQGINPSKGVPENSLMSKEFGSMVRVVTFSGFLHKFIRKLDAEQNTTIHAVIRGLRNGADLQYEQNQQYWYEDLGLKIPIVYFITDRKLGHISSSAIREIEKIRG